MDKFFNSKPKLLIDFFKDMIQHKVDYYKVKFNVISSLKIVPVNGIM